MNAALPRRLLTSAHLAARALRFACVGGLSAALYAIVTALLIGRWDVGPVLASVAGYCAAVPLSFTGHRGFSFRSRGRRRDEAARFALAQALNIAVTAGAMQAAVAALRVSYVWGMAGAVILVPIANFAAMNFWVFRAPAAERPR